MPNYRSILRLLAKGGKSQSDIASMCGCSKRAVSRAAAVAKEQGLTAERVAAMGDEEISALFPRKPRPKDEGHLMPDVASLAGRKRKSPKVPIKHYWYEYCGQAESAGLIPYSYQAFCEMLSEEAKRTGLAAHLRHAPGEKAFIDWCGSCGTIVDRLTGGRSKAYVLVVVLPCSAKLSATSHPDVSERSWLDGQMRAFEGFGGVPHILVPDNAATATDRTAPYVCRVNSTYRDFAEHYGCAVLPARVRHPRDKSLAEETVDLIEKWAIAPSSEQTFYSIDEFDEYLQERVRWLNSRPFANRDGCRDSESGRLEADALLPLPASRYEICEWRRAKVAPNYHVRVDYMNYSVPYGLAGETCDVRLTDSRVTVMHDGQVVAEHDRLRGRKGQYSTIEEHMPESHRDAQSPWSEDRFVSWAERIGPSTREAVERNLKARPIVEQAFVPCLNILGLSKRYGSSLLERACERLVSSGPAVPSYSALKDTILRIRAEDARSPKGAPPAGRDEPADRAPHAGRLNGAEAYRRKGGDAAC